MVVNIIVTNINLVKVHVQASPVNITENNLVNAIGPENVRFVQFSLSCARDEM